MENILMLAQMALSSVLDTDSYKLSHWVQYPKKTTGMSSYFESRGGKFDKTLFFGLQYLLIKYFSQPITIDQVKEAAEFSELHGCPFNYGGWMLIATDLKGKLPIRIRAIPEGTVIPNKNLLLDVKYTDERFFWVVSWFETMLVRLWYPIIVATNSWYMKQDIRKYLELSSDDPEGEIAFKLHDFGSRGVTCQEQAMIGGAAHLVNFLGSDTIAGIWMANKFYNEQMSAFSIPASEHSTMTMWGKDNEVEAYRNMIKKYGDKALFACVSDSWDIFNACENLWGGKLKQEVIGMNAMLVCRPDSGDPDEVVNQMLHIFENKFGAEPNRKGYKVLNHVRVIQGDGIGRPDVNTILKRTTEDGFSATNTNFGMGGGLLQTDLNRDTNKFAFKCSWAEIDGKSVPVYKDPVTDTVKKSKKGLMDVVRMGNGLIRTVPQNANYPNSILRTVYDNGEILVLDTLAEIRKRSNQTPYEQHIGWVERDVY